MSISGTKQWDSLIRIIYEKYYSHSSMITILTEIEHCTAVAQCIMAVASHSEQLKSP